MAGELMRVAVRRRRGAGRSTGRLGSTDVQELFLKRAGCLRRSWDRYFFMRSRYLRWRVFPGRAS